MRRLLEIEANKAFIFILTSPCDWNREIYGVDNEILPTGNNQHYLFFPQSLSPYWKKLQFTETFILLSTSVFNSDQSGHLVKT